MHYGAGGAGGFAGGFIGGFPAKRSFPVILQAVILAAVTRVPRAPREKGLWSRHTTVATVIAPAQATPRLFGSALTKSRECGSGE